MITSAEEFVRLRQSSAPEDYRRAITEAASPEVWLEVISRMPEIKREVALNKALPIEIHELLARDESPQIRSLVADRRQLPSHVIQLLSEDPDESVRARIANNKKTSLEILLRLTKDSSPIVSEAALKRLNESVKV